MSDPDVAEDYIQKLFDDCLDPAKGTYEEFKANFLKARQAKIIMGIRASKKWSGVPPCGRNHFPE